MQAVTLDPFLANLSGGEGYVKVTITLSVHKPEAAAEAGKEKAAEASAALLQSAIVRDTILADLSTQTAAVLLTAEGKAALKTTLKSDLDREGSWPLPRQPLLHGLSCPAIREPHGSTDSG